MPQRNHSKSWQKKRKNIRGNEHIFHAFRFFLIIVNVSTVINFDLQYESINKYFIDMCHLIDFPNHDHLKSFKFTRKMVCICK